MTLNSKIQDVFGTFQERLKTRKNLLNSRKALRQVVSDLENEVTRLECELANRKSDLTNSKNDLAKVEDEILKIQNDLEDDLAKAGPLVHGAAAAGSNAPHQLWRVPELVDTIASYCDRSVLASLGLVCKAWYRIATPRLWRHVRIKNSNDIDKCKNHRDCIVTVESPFEPWLLLLLPLLPNLSELFLHDVTNLDTLAALFDLNIRVLKLDKGKAGWWDFNWGPSVDRVRARSFLHRLVSIDFGLVIPYWYDTMKMTVIEDVMHEGLRKIDFGMFFYLRFNLPIDYL
ncbi:hypothetical protein HK102_008919, partial [Quaeritorhiza haematococci]